LAEADRARADEFRAEARGYREADSAERTVQLSLVRTRAKALLKARGR
jgi:hypothetical protein